MEVSSWHDIPLPSGDDIFNLIVEIPKVSNAKMEVAIDEAFTIIKQDTEKGKAPILHTDLVSYLHILFMFSSYNIHWNYGLLPQTWENPSFANSKVEGALEKKIQLMLLRLVKERKIGEVLKVKPLGALAMIDEGELDSKIVAISVDDPKASLVNYVNDIEKHFTVISLLPNYLITSFISLLLFIL
ncbi:Soluble inorganic pyrophosphatase [Vigna angularis]|uniref:inorganic diphosphatase n=1 Tax=Phaseolus angularis TaxID=3914 RepID=A0A8T0K7K3_PHAAN|nr:Soluble inorganic pyrophosphatase [Vigna angularis]